MITLKELMNKVSTEVESDWFSIGFQLNLSHSLLKKIEADNPNSVQRCCAEMFAEWLSQDKAASWSTLMDALTSKSVAKRKLAETLGTRYS